MIKTIKSIPFLLVALSVLAAPTLAQDKLTALTYDISIPGGQMDDFIDRTSWLGVSFDARKFRDRNSPFMLGFSLGWHVFDQRATGTSEIEFGAVTGTSRRYINSFPIMITGHYYLGNPRGTRYFAGLGAGVYYIIQRFEIGVWTNEANNWHFGLVPELGIQYPFGSADLLVSLKYNYAFEAGTDVFGGKSGFDYIGINVGLAWRGW